MSPEERRARKWKTKYGIRNFSADDYTFLLVRQEGRCAICKRYHGRRLVPDHNHQTGLVRGLLCNDCNLGIGKLADDADRVQRAADYLREA